MQHVHPKPEHLPEFESLDGPALGEMRPACQSRRRGRRAVRPAALARPPAPDLRTGAGDAVRRGRSLLIVTRLVEQHRFHNGEIEGPLGSIALARVLTLLSYPVTIPGRRRGRPHPRRPGRHHAGRGHSRAGGEFRHGRTGLRLRPSSVSWFAIDTHSCYSKSVRHLVWGTPCETGDPYVDDYILAVAEAGAMTLAVDNGRSCPAERPHVSSDQVRVWIDWAARSLCAAGHRRPSVRGRRRHPHPLCRGACRPHLRSRRPISAKTPDAAVAVDREHP
jgi:hypothetical protein